MIHQILSRPEGFQSLINQDVYVSNDGTNNASIVNDGAIGS